MKQWGNLTSGFVSRPAGGKLVRSVSTSNRSDLAFSTAISLGGSTSLS